MICFDKITEMFPIIGKFCKDSNKFTQSFLYEQIKQEISAAHSITKTK